MPQLNIGQHSSIRAAQNPELCRAMSTYVGLCRPKYFSAVQGVADFCFLLWTVVSGLLVLLFTRLLSDSAFVEP
jgi:hypothetical protein